MLMYTSCGWFFDELSGIETVQVIQYAGRVVQIAMELFGDHLEQRFLEKLALAKSNLPEHRRRRRDLRQVREAGHDRSLIRWRPTMPSVRCLRTTRKAPGSTLTRLTRELYRTMEAGKMRVAVGRARFTSEITQKSEELTFGVLHFGDHNLNAGVRSFGGNDQFAELNESIAEAFSRADLAEAIRLMDKGFGTETYSLKDLFKDEQRRVVNEILKSTLGEAEAAVRATLWESCSADAIPDELRHSASAGDEEYR